MTATPGSRAGVANADKETTMKNVLSMTIALLVAIPMMAGPNTQQPVAVIGSTPISQDELDRAVGVKLTRILTDEYNVKRAVLDDLIATKLIANEAAKRSLAVEQLLKLEVDGKIVAPNVAEIEPVYEGVSERYPGMTKDQALNEIAESMRRSRISARYAEFVRELKRAAGVQVYIQPPRADVKAEGPSLGNANAPVTIVEFSDFECPFCGHVVETLKKIESTYGDKVRVVFRDYPLVIHRTAKRAAEASHCAEDQGKFWEMHDKLFSKGGPIQDADIYRYAQQIKLDHDQFDQCLTSGKFKDAYKTSQDEGTRVGVQSTPTFFINGRLIVGAASYDAFARVIDDELSGAAQPQTKVASK